MGGVDYRQTLQALKKALESRPPSMALAVS